MILQSLVKLYENLTESGELEQPGWSPVKVSWGLEIDDEGALKHAVPLQQQIPKGKKTIWVPQVMNVPSPVKRTVGIAANFLCDNSSYVLGVDNKGKPERSIKCFEAFRQKHHELLDDCNLPSAQALLRFLDRWNPADMFTHPALVDFATEILEGGNMIFIHHGLKLHELPEFQRIWQANYANEADSIKRQCLVSGQRAPVQILHPSIKGVMGAQSSGASLVSFNASALESYGCDGAQGMNAPVSTYAAFAYGAALNYLLSSPKHHLLMGETTVVCWAEGSSDTYADFLTTLFTSDTIDDQMLFDALQAVANGRNASWNDMPLQADNRFFVLGLAPNAARLSVRFFLCDTFGGLMKNVKQHQEQLGIAKPAFDRWNELSLWWLLRETVNQHSREKQPHAQMTGDMMRAILQGTPYPATLFEQVQLRIRAERKITRGRAAIIKAYLLRNPNYPHKEVLTVNLNEETNYQPYLLGRLFSLLEALQERANPGISATIRDRYFSSACATPAIVFPTLLKLAQAHLKKLDTGVRIYYDKQIQDLIAHMNTSYPTRLSLQDQGVFQIGYYHQTQQRYNKKEEEKNV